MTSIHALPLLTVTAEIAANEDWRDSFGFATAAEALALAAAGNTGNGTIGVVAVATGAPVGAATIRTLAAGIAPAFGVFDSNGKLRGSGQVGLPYRAGGLGFTLAAGSAAFAAGDAFTIETLPGPIDLTGIAFALMVRAAPGDIHLLLNGSTTNGLLVNGGALGVLATAFPVEQVRRLSPGSYPFDVRATADGITKRVVAGTLLVDAASTI